MLTCAWHRPGAQGRGLPVASTVLPKPEFPLSAPEVGGGPLHQKWEEGDCAYITVVTRGPASQSLGIHPHTQTLLQARPGQPGYSCFSEEDPELLRGTKTSQTPSWSGLEKDSGLGLGKSKHQARPSLQGQWAHPSASWSQGGDQEGGRGPRGAASGKAGGDRSPTETWPRFPMPAPLGSRSWGLKPAGKARPPDLS